MPTPTRFPTNRLYTPMGNTSLHSISSVCHPCGECCCPIVHRAKFIKKSARIVHPIGDRVPSTEPRLHVHNACALFALILSLSSNLSRTIRFSIRSVARYTKLTSMKVFSSWSDQWDIRNGGLGHIALLRIDCQKGQLT